MLKRPLLKSEILAVQENARSAAECARLLGVSYRTYKKYAELYGIFKNVYNPLGFGIEKGYSFSRKYNSAKLKDIFDNKHPKYPLQRLRWRLVKRKLIKDECMVCGFSEPRITDKKKPLVLIFNDKHGDYSLSNLKLLCFNCVFLTRNAPTLVNRRDLHRMIHDPESYTPTKNKFKNPEPDSVIEDEIELSEKELDQLMREIDLELGRKR